ncbi:YslB family protein [Alkalihalophilus sp. As8PL]|uniref:YslB family protein n=2 Tax=Alkalihalophilus TaxID=2893060 RepID=A0AB39BQN8_9BACI|nr:YslB family protein [Alkalihalophilus lindianensis]MDV2684839.1 YslB family protein [Alkalihalophilus lindianensis]
MEPRQETFGYELLRNDVLKEVFGQEYDSILYWVGKSIARKYPLHTIEEVIEFFNDANWGNLTLVKEKKNERHFELEGEWMKKNDTRCYQLEAGFLAQQVETWLSSFTAATQTKKKGIVHLQIESDLQDSLAL